MSRSATPPCYDEISVKNLYGPCLELPGMAEYFPDAYPKSKACSREYFFSILNTLHPEYTQRLIRKSKSCRFSLDAEHVQKEAILIDPQWEEELREFPQFSRSKGRML